MNEHPETEIPQESAGDAFDWIEILVTALVACVLILVFIGRSVGVIGPSMQDTLIEKDRLIITNLFYTPHTGDIVVLRKTSFKTDPIIKRVIATEGQTVDIDFDAGVVYVDGVQESGAYLERNAKTQMTTLREEFEGPVTVPEGCVFVMGDNRNQSTDSRTKSIGCVDTRFILGRAVFRIYPFNKFGKIS